MWLLQTQLSQLPGVWLVARLASAASNSAIGMLHVSHAIAGAAFTLFESK